MIKTNFYTLPQAMYTLDAIKPILLHENNAILYKELEDDMLDMEKIIVSHSIVYIQSGSVNVETYNYQKFSANDGEMLFMPRDSYLISDYINNNEPMKVFLFFFDYAITSEFLNQFDVIGKESNQNITKLNVSKNILHYIELLRTSTYKQAENRHLLKTKLFELLHLICECNEDFIHILKKQENRVKTDIKTYMTEHYDKNLSVKDWADLSGYSLSTFNRKFKKEYSLSPKKWMIQHNMKLANEALKNGSNVSECATSFGYSNTSNFIKAYKEIYKTTPKQHVLT